jgi:hypothetical protein
MPLISLSSCNCLRKKKVKERVRRGEIGAVAESTLGLGAACVSKNKDEIIIIIIDVLSNGFSQSRRGCSTVPISVIDTNQSTFI